MHPICFFRNDWHDRLMKRVFVTVVALITLFVVAFFVYDRDRPIAKKWTVWVDDGKTELVEIDPIMCDNLAESYFDLLKQITYWNVVDRGSEHGTPAQRAPYRLDNITLTRIGKWGKYDVLDLTNKSIGHKSILLKDERGHFRALYIQWYMTLENDLPVITNINGHEVLSYVSDCPGTANPRIEHHFIYDAVLDSQVRVDTETVIKTAIKEAVPKGYGVWKDGGLNFTTMTFFHAIWKPGDANCCPTGGAIDLRLSLEKGKLSVVSSRYQPEYVWK